MVGERYLHSAGDQLPDSTGDKLPKSTGDKLPESTGEELPESTGEDDSTLLGKLLDCTREWLHWVCLYSAGEQSYIPVEEY